MESRWSGADPRSDGVGAGVYANNAPLRARGGAAVEQIVENYQDQFELILIWFMQRRDGTQNCVGASLTKLDMIIVIRWASKLLTRM